MAQYNERDWRQTKDTEQLTFTAGEDLPYSEYVREDPIGSHIVVSTTQALAIGYVLSPKGALVGEKVDIQMLRGLGSSSGGGGGGSVNSVNAGTNVTITGPATDPVINAQNIYTNNGSLTSARTVSFNNFNLSFVATAAERFNLFNHMFRQDVNGVELGYLTSIAGVASDVFLDFRSESNAIQPDWSARIIRDAGENAGFYIANRGTGPLNFTTGAGSAANLDGLTRQFQLVAYGVGSFLNTPAYNLGVDAAGNVIEVPASGGGSNVIDFQYDITTETATISTDLPSTFQAVWPLQHRNVIEVRKDGNDATAPLSTVAPYSIQNPFLTFEEAWNAAGPDDVIWVRPGSYTPAVPLSWTPEKPKYVYCDPGVVFTTAAGTLITFNEKGEFYWGGAATFDVQADVFVNSSDYLKLVWEFNEAYSTSGTQIASLRNTDCSIRVNKLNGVGFDFRAWVRAKIAVDYWETKNWLFFTSDPTGATFDEYGQAQIYVSGRSSDKAYIKRTSSGSAGIQLGAGAFNSNSLQVEIDANWDWTDGYGIDQQAGNLIMRGTVIQRKTGSAGNELPFYNAINTSPGAQEYKPVFRFYGTMVMAGSLFNNTMVDIRVAGDYQLFGQFKCSGQDEQGLSTPFPCVSVSNQDVDSETRVVFDGVFSTGRDADVGPIRITEIGNPSNTLRIEFLNVLAICQNEEKTVGPIYGTSASGALPLYPYHSLAMTGPWDTTYFYNALSVDRTYYDTSIRFSIPEYEGP